MRIRSLLALLVVFLCASLAAQAYRLEFKDRAGDVRTYSSEVTIAGSMQLGTMVIPMNSVVKMTAEEKILGVKNGLASVSYTLKSGTMSVTLDDIFGEGEPTTINQPMAEFRMTFNRSPQGKITGLKMTGEGAQMFGGPVDDILSRLENVGQGLEFPARDLKAGDTWSGKETVNLGAGNTATLDVIYTLKGEEAGPDGKKYLRVDTAVSINAPKLTMNVMGQPVSIKINMQGAGATLFSEAAGAVYQTSYTYSGTTEMSMAGEAESAKVPLTMSGVCTLK